MNNSPFIHMNGGRDMKMDKGKHDQIPIEAILYSYFIKYDKLKQLTLEQFSNSNSDTVNVYIDMYSMIRPLYNRDIIGCESLFTSNVLNLCSHMRAYYRSRFSVETNIFIIYTSNTTDLNSFNTNNHKVLSNTQRDNIIAYNIGLLKILCPYIPNVYLVQGTVHPSIMIGNTISLNEKSYPGVPNIIITKDMFSWQLPTIFSNTCIFRPRKTNGGDTSFCVNEFNAIPMWKLTVNHSKCVRDFVLPPQMLSLYIAFTMFPDINLHSYYNSQVADKKIMDLINRNLLLPGYNFPDAIENVLHNENKACYKEVYNTINNLEVRYKIVDIKRLIMLYQERMIESKDRSYIIDKIDTESVKEINDKYFIKNPIDTIRLF